MHTLRPGETMFLLQIITWSSLILAVRSYIHDPDEKDIQPLCVIEFNELIEDNLTISWKLPSDVISYENQSNLHPIVTWTSDYSYGNCTVTTLTSCICYYGNDDVMDSDSIFSLNVTIVDEGSDETQVYHTGWTIDSEKCLKPSPVKDVTLTSINSTCVNVTWYPLVMCSDEVYYEAMTFSVSYRRTVDTEWIVTVCDQHCVNCTYPYTICGLIPYTGYEVKVQRKLFDSNNQPTGHWSDGTARTIITDEDVPSGPPQLIEGGYTVLKDNCKQENSIVIRIYWKEVKNHLRNGNITTHQIHVVNSQTKVKETFVTNTSLCHYDVTVQCGMDYNISIFAGTSVGLSSNFAEILASGSTEKTGTGDSKDELIIPEISMNHQSIIITMATKVHISEYRYLVWCETDIKYTCKGPIDWKNITSSDTVSSINTSSVSVPLSKLKVGVTKPGPGITWASCLYMETKAIPRPRSLHAIPSYIENAGIEVAWDSVRCSTGHIQPYVVSIKLYVCPTAHIGNPTCSGNFFKSPIFIVFIVILSIVVILTIIFFIRKLARKVQMHYKQLSDIHFELDDLDR